MNKYNNGIKEHHDTKREETIQTIEDAIQRIKDFEGENAIITAKKLVEETGLSRSALYKQHALKVWNPKLWEEKYVEKSKIEIKLESKYSNELEALQKQVEILTNKLNRLEMRNEKLQKDLETEKKRREVKGIEYEEERAKNMRLLGELQRLQGLQHSNS